MGRLEQNFDEAMMNIYRRAKSEFNYTPSIFFDMLIKHRGVETAKRLIHAKKVSDGYTKLYELGGLHLTVEAMIHDNSKWHRLFSIQELAICKARLTEYHYFNK